MNEMKVINTTYKVSRVLDCLSNAATVVALASFVLAIGSILKKSKI